MAGVLVVSPLAPREQGAGEGEGKGGGAGDRKHGEERPTVTNCLKLARRGTHRAPTQYPAWEEQCWASRRGGAGRGGGGGASTFAADIVALSLLASDRGVEELQAVSSFPHVSKYFFFQNPVICHG